MSHQFRASHSSSSSSGISAAAATQSLAPRVFSREFSRILGIHISGYSESRKINPIVTRKKLNNPKRIENSFYLFHESRQIAEKIELQLLMIILQLILYIANLYYSYFTAKYIFAHSREFPNFENYNFWPIGNSWFSRFIFLFAPVATKAYGVRLTVTSCHYNHACLHCVQEYNTSTHTYCNVVEFGEWEFALVIFVRVNCVYECICVSIWK